MFYKKLPSLNILVISVSFAFMHNSALANNVIVDVAKSENTTVNKNKDGSEIIYIDNANDIRLSVNYFEQFNVGKEGVNIDNSEAKAKVILNEVTSKKTSLLEGKISILGQDAELIIANPNGIDCYGCQFSGSDKVMLIAGSLDSTNMDNFKLSGGSVNLKNVINLNEKQMINVFSNSINILGKNKIPLFNVVNGYERVSFVDYVWKGEQEKVLSKNNKKEGMSILENSSLKTDFFSLQGGAFNLDGKLVTKKINIIQNKEINGSEKAVLKIANEINSFREYNKAETVSILALMKLELLKEDANKLDKIALELQDLKHHAIKLDPHGIHKNTKEIIKTADKSRRVADQALEKIRDAENMLLSIDQVRQEEKTHLESNKKIIGSEKQYIESDNFNFKGKLAIINSEVDFNVRNINIDSDQTKVTSYFKNSDVLFNAHKDNHYSGKFGLINSDIKFLGNRNIQIGNNSKINELDKNKLNDINLNKLSMFGSGHVVVFGENVNLTDTKFKFRQQLSDPKLSENYIDLIASNEITIKGQFKPSLINKNNLFKYANKITENDKVIFNISTDKIQ